MEAERSNLQAVAAEQRQQDAGTARRLVDGASLGDVRLQSHDGTLGRITADLKNARAGLALAEQDVERAATAAAAELARAFAPTYRQAARRAVVAWVAFVGQRFGVGRTVELPSATEAGSADDARLINTWRSQPQQSSTDLLLEQILRVTEQHLRATERIPDAIPRIPRSGLPGD